MDAIVHKAIGSFHKAILDGFHGSLHVEDLKEAVIYVNGDIAKIPVKDIFARFNEALGRLVQTVYHKLSYIDTPMEEASIRKLMRRANGQCAVVQPAVIAGGQDTQTDIMVLGRFIRLVIYRLVVGKGVPSAKIRAAIFFVRKNVVKDQSMS